MTTLCRRRELTYEKVDTSPKELTGISSPHRNEAKRMSKAKAAKTND